MRKLKHNIVLLTLLLGSSSCTTAKLEELRQTSPQGTPFQMALAREYLAFSESEAEQYDWVDSYHFADKGLRVAYGQDVVPEIPEDWNLPEERMNEFAEGRKKLLEQLNPENLSKKAALAARAQYFYDCWLEQEEEAWQHDDIAACRDGFAGALKELSAKEEAGEPTPIMRTTAYMIFFDHNKAKITPEGMQVLHRILDDLQKVPEVDILLHGHADASGTQDYNMGLSETRAMAVRDALIADGIDEKRIVYYAFGETDLRVPTADGIREPGNRRVEIFLE